VLAAARGCFADAGYEQTTIRAVAAAAGVDPALVMQQHGSKEGLFRAVVGELPGYIREHAPELDRAEGTFGERLARMYFTAWEVPEVRETFLAVLRSAGSNRIAVEILVEAFAGELLPRVSAVVGRADARDVLAPVAAQLLGTAMARFVLQVPLFDGFATDDLVASTAPVVDAILARAAQPG
jgi:AcrR family transcriptional regulator